MIAAESTILVSPPVDFPAATKRYIVARTVRTPYSDLEVDYIINLYREACKTGNVDIELALTQMVHETAALTSDWSQPPKRNPAGIGVTGALGADGQPLGQWFETWLDSVQAHVGLLLAYRFAAGQGNEGQQRLINHLLTFRSPPRAVGSTVGQMAAKWAADTAYVSKLSAIAAAIAKA